MLNNSVIMNHVEDFGLPGCKAVSSGDWCPMFQWIVVPSCVRFKESHCCDLKSCMGNILSGVCCFHFQHRSYNLKVLSVYHINILTPFTILIGYM